MDKSNSNKALPQREAGHSNGQLSETSSYIRKTGNTRYGLFFWSPIIMTSIATASLISISGWGSASITVSILLLLASVFTGWLLHRRHINIIEDLLQKKHKSELSEASFYSQILPIWSRQISTSRDVGDKAVTKLTVLFGDIVSKLEAMLKISRKSALAETVQGSEKGFLDVVANSKADIKSVLTDLKTALEVVNDSKDMLLAEITMYSVKMKEMAEDANLVAFQSQIIALNAEIEAARAGNAGRAFAAVVSEMRELARQSREASKKMTQQVDSIDSAMIRFYENDKEMSVKESQQLSSAEAMFNDIMERFNKVTVELEDSISILGTESKHIQNNISSALVQLQFQDRVSQIMDHVASNISELTEAGTQDLDTDAWLNEMKNKFTAEEEHSNLSGDQTSSVQSSSLTFF